MPRLRGFKGFGDLAFSDLARLIFRQEGALNADGSWDTSSLGYRFNNPGNLVYAGQAGASPQTAYDPGMHATQSYAKFDTLDHGIQATQRQLALDASRGLTLEQRLRTWATGNQDAYVRNVSTWAGVDPGTPLSELSAGFLKAPLSAQTAGPEKGTAPHPKGTTPAKS